MIVGWQQGKNGNAGLLVFTSPSVPDAVSAADDSSTTSFSKASGTDFTVDGRPFFVTGAKNHDRTFGAQDEVTRLVDDAMAIGADMVRSFRQPKIGSLDRSITAIPRGRQGSVAAHVAARRIAVPGRALRKSLSGDHARCST